MQEQNFERQVRERMEELNIPPSAPVWQKIEREIRKDKDRRRVIFWVLPLLITAGIIWWIVDSNNGSPEPSIVQTEKKNTIEAKQHAPIEDQPTERNKSNANTQKETETTSVSLAAITKNSSIINGTIIRSNVSGKDNRTNSTIKASQDPNGSVAPDTDPVEQMVDRSKTDVKETTSPVIQNQETQIVPSKTETTTPVKGESITPPKAETTEPAKTEAATPAEKEKTSQPDSVKSSPIQPGKKKIQVGLQAIAGLSQSASTLFPVTKAAETSMAPQGIGFAPPASYSPPEIGKHFSAGISLSTSLTSRIRLTTGLQYSYASTEQKVGEKRDSVINNGDPLTFVWLNNQTTPYTNSYHFLEIPVGVDIKLLNAIPVDLQAGVSVSRLISSNALHYNQSANYYFRDNDLLNKTSVNLFAGMSYGLLKERLKIGPQFQYSLVPLNKSENRQYLMTAGLKAKWLIN